MEQRTVGQLRRFAHELDAALVEDGDVVGHAEDANQIQTNYYYNATPGAAQRDIKAALRVQREVRALADLHRSGDAAAFAQAYRLALKKLANSLASPGFAPIASVATQNAALARREFIDMLVAKRGGQHAQP